VAISSSAALTLSGSGIKVASGEELPHIMDGPGELEQTMQPFPAHSLGWFCLGYHMSDVLGRDKCIADLLLRSQVAPAELCTATVARPVLAKLLSLHANWVTVHPSSVATVTVLIDGSPRPHSLAPCVQEWVPVVAKQCCGRALVRWRLLPAVFLTIASGLRRGHVVCLKCYTCNSVYAGCWKWLQVLDCSNFPDGFHKPLLASTSTSLGHRWFFATPQVVVEFTLLAYLLGLLARGGVSFTAFAVVYTGMWSASMRGTMYMQRTHFLQKLELNVIAYASVLMFAESGLDVKDFIWHLRPHHEADDFAGLLVLVRQAFALLSAAHACWLFRRVRALITDGKWCIQTSICNARDCNPVFSAAIREGYFKGCVERPVRGSLYCKAHGHGHGSRKAAASDDVKVTSHRKVVKDDGVFLEYRVEGVWLPATVVDTADVRAYEKWMLRKRTPTLLDEECNKDTRKGVDETVCGRKTAGIFVAVTPCLQIAAITPMFASESVAQLLLFLLNLRTLFEDLVYVIYDNACAVVRHLRKRLRESPPADPDDAAWKWLMAFKVGH
jgi:hypothetical protein